MKDLFRSRVFSWTIFVVVGISAYFINVEVQSYFGRQALKNTGLVSTRYEQALAAGRQEHKLVLVDVSAIWCPTCRRLDNSVFSDPRVKRLIRDKYIFSRIEYESDTGTRFLERHYAWGMPNLWLIDGNDNVVKRLRVTFDPENFMRQIRITPESPT